MQPTMMRDEAPEEHVDPFAIPDFGQSLMLDHDASPSTPSLLFPTLKSLGMSLH